MSRRALIRLNGRDAGLLEETDEGIEFRYLPEWLALSDAVPVSLTLPLRPAPWKTGRSLHPFFENLLPEGWLLEISTTRLKVPKDDVFGLLLATCSDCIGAVEVVPINPKVENG